MNQRISKCVAAATMLAATALLGPTNTAKATFQVKITDVGTSTTLTFNQTGTDLNGNPAILVNQNVGNFGVSLELVTSNFPGTMVLAFLNQSGSSITNNSATSDTIIITATATGYNSPTAPPPVTLGSALSGTVTSGTITGVTFDSAVGTTNAAYETSISAPQITSAASGPSGALSGTSNKRINTLGSPYSLTNSLNATFSGKAMVTNLAGNTTLTPTPEPGTIAMALSALPLLGLAYRRRRRAPAQ